MKILHVIPSISKSYGGPSYAIFSYVKNLRKLGLNAEILTSDIFLKEKAVSKKNKTKIEAIPLYIIKTLKIPILKIYEFGISYKMFFWLKKNISKYEIIHIYSLFRFSTSITMYFAIKKNIPFIIYPAGGLDKEIFKKNNLFKKIYLKYIDKNMLQKASSFHFNSEKEYKEASTIGFKFKYFITPVGIDQIPFKELIQKKEDSRDINFLFMSRIHPIKRLEIIIRAFGVIKSSKPKAYWKLHIAGDGNKKYIDELKSLIKKEGLSKKIIWYGFISNKKKENLLKKSDWFILTSKSESFGISIIEALSWGIPALISKEIPLSNEIQKNNSGYIINDNPKNLAQEIERKFLKKPNLDIIANSYNFAKNNFSDIEISKIIKEKYIELT